MVVNMINVSHHGGVTSGSYPITATNIAKNIKKTAVVVDIINVATVLGDIDSLKTVKCSSIEKTILVELYMISVPTVEETGLVVVLPITRAQRGHSCCLYD